MKKLKYFALFFLTGTSSLNAGPLTIPHEFESGSPARASEVNENFEAVKTEVDDNSSRIDNKQSRVAGTCEVGSAIRSIEEDGTVICQTSSVSSLPYRVFLQDGLDGYSGTTDTSLYKVPETGNPEPGSFARLYSEFQYEFDDASGILAVLRFDVSSVVSEAENFMRQFDPDYSISDCSAQVIVKNAKLQIRGSGSGGDYNSSVRVAPFSGTAPLFDEMRADWDNANASEMWEKIFATSREIFADLDTGFSDAKDTPRSSWQTFMFHVAPSIVENWICDSSSNRGMAIEMSGSEPGRMMLLSREYPERGDRPMLIIDLGLE